MRSVLLSLLIPLSLSGCSLIKVNGKGVGSSSPAQSAQSAEAAQAAQAAESGEARPSAADAAPIQPRKGDKAQELYAQVSYKAPPPSGPDLFLSAGVEQNYSLKKGLNPDPTWLTGWDRLSGLDEPKAAVVQAAINRTWTADVHAYYAQLRDRRKAVEDKLRPRLADAIALPFAERTAALATLWTELGEATVAAQLEPTEVGLGAEVVAAMVAAHREAGVEMLLNSYLNERGISLATFAQRGRARAEDDVERDLFTSAAQASGAGTIPALPTTREYGSAFSGIAWPTSDARDQKTAAARDQLIAAMRPSFEFTVPESRHVFNGEGASDGKPLAFFASTGDWTPLVVTKVGDGTITLGTRYEQKIPYDCRLMNPLDPNSLNCYKVRTKVKGKDVVVVSFDALPVPLKKDDQVSFYGEITKESAKGDNRTFEVKLRAVTKIVRGGQALLDR